MKKPIKCCICKKVVEIKRHSAMPRKTCSRIKVSGKWIKSECEKERNRRYQKKYRASILKTGKPKKMQVKSVAVYDFNSLLKIENEKVNRICLKCNKKFMADGKFNRICSSCATENKKSKYQINKMRL